MANLIKKRVKEFDTPYTVRAAAKEGNAVTRLSMLIMGLGNLVHKQIIKGLLYLAIEVAYILFIYEYTGGDMTILFLLYGIATLFVTAAFLIAWRANVKSAYEVECRAKNGKHINNLKEDIAALFDKKLHWTLLTPPWAGIIVFTILP